MVAGWDGVGVGDGEMVQCVKRFQSKFDNLCLILQQCGNREIL